MKKLFIALGVFSIIGLASPSTSHAASVDVVSDHTDISDRLCRDVEVTPDNPLHLRGTGSAHAKGHGEAYFTMKRGTLKFNGHGVVALRVSDDDQIRAAGMGGKHQIGPWLVYWGKGKLQVTGDDYQVISFGRLSIEGKGTGDAQFHGDWKVEVCKLVRVDTPLPVPDLLPQSLDIGR